MTNEYYPTHSNSISMVIYTRGIIDPFISNSVTVSQGYVIFLFSLSILPSALA